MERIVVKPNCPKNSISDEGAYYKVELKAKPKEGEANRELVKFLSKHFKKKVKIVSGLKSRIKFISFED